MYVTATKSTQPGYLYMGGHNEYQWKLCRKKPKHSKAQSTMPTSRDVRDKPW